MKYNSNSIHYRRMKLEKQIQSKKRTQYNELHQLKLTHKTRDPDHETVIT